MGKFIGILLLTILITGGHNLKYVRSVYYNELFIDRIVHGGNQERKPICLSLEWRRAGGKNVTLLCTFEREE
ncbi:hypothetical protein [Methanosarcina sp. UBA5]|uniref:hypothetical protein n=1 Tax=Methanosarcina sp. UBA5 TaxID=1915593 RepID=UPI0025F213BD|nr:hypothetical protein [Methanosarcina sp. UBA5]